MQWISTQEILYEAFDFQQSEETDLIWKQISMQRAKKKGAHFHLVNNGHEMVTVVSRNGKKVQGGGKTVGFVAGRRIKEPVIERWHQEHAKRAEKCWKKIHEEIEK